MEAHIQSLKNLLKVKEDLDRKKAIIEELEHIESHLDQPGAILKKRTLDHELDLVDDIEEYHLAQALEQVDRHLALEKPEWLETFKALTFARQSAMEEAEDIHHWSEFYQIVLKHLDRIHEIRKSLDGLGFLRHFFGTRPTAEITLEIHTLQKHLQNLEKPIKNAAFAELADTTAKRWNFKMIDQIYIPMRKKLTEELNKLRIEEKKAVEASLAAENKLYRWLEEILRL